ncbi:hypothetical protein [Rhodococcus sp. IEGM 1408]|uniref:hypothetical protein n=1 Tax=Rhodococcus sp. IEGM 1408 TaxID=3082220 RepID=UPI00295412A2|nr:hypothetical protein [Rhodococcus sp. IEGM 1408]MDV8001421.1 hypothetical protein [Rhodococcus sp. IEGM 1408]
MNDEFSPNPYDLESGGQPYTDQFADRAGPTQQFSGQQYPARQFPGQQYPGQQYPGQQYHRPPEPLAHEGGLAYGNPPAAPYGHPDQFVPQHLAAPHPYAPGMYAPGPPYQQQFLPHQMPQQQMHQTVFVNGGGGSKGVNHLLHLILTLLTAGLWLPVWIIIAMAKS